MKIEIIVNPHVYYTWLFIKEKLRFLALAVIKLIYKYFISSLLVRQSTSFFWSIFYPFKSQSKSWIIILEAKLIAKHKRRLTQVFLHVHSIVVNIFLFPLGEPWHFLVSFILVGLSYVCFYVFWIAKRLWRIKAVSFTWICLFSHFEF